MQKKYLMVLADYQDWRQEFFEEHMSPRNKEYCNIHNYEYLEIKNFRSIRNSPTWAKFTVLQDLVKDGTVREGDLFTHIDADMCIVKKNNFLTTNKSFSYAIDSANSHNMGWYSMKINSWSVSLLDNILSEERYKKLNDQETYHPYFKKYSSFWHDAKEQASWYSLAGISRHSEKSFWKLPNYGWHSDLNDTTLYSLNELIQNVEVYPTKWNVSDLKGESNCKFLKNRVYYHQTIIRHFAGGQDWRKDWFNSNSISFHLKHLNPVNYFNLFPVRRIYTFLKGLKLSIKKGVN
jgi:hypothetical protein